MPHNDENHGFESNCQGIRLIHFVERYAHRQDKKSKDNLFELHFAVDDIAKDYKHSHL
jgi:hypothetical protein